MPFKRGHPGGPGRPKGSRNFSSLSENPTPVFRKQKQCEASGGRVGRPRNLANQSGETNKRRKTTDQDDTTCIDLEASITSTGRIDKESHPQEPSKKVQCGNCGEDDHQVINCLKSRNGVIRGCGCCNSSKHATEECADFPKDIKRQVDIVVVKRGDMPPLASPDWYPILFEAVIAGVTDAMDGHLPWAVEFAAGIERLMEGDMEGFEKESGLDSDIKDWAAAQDKYGGIPACLYAALEEEKAALKLGRAVRSKLRPSRIFRFKLSQEDEDRLEKAKGFLENSSS